MKIERVQVLQIDLAPKVRRTDAIQSFVTQETPIVRIFCDDGAVGTGYTYTIGTGGSSVVALLRDHLAPRLIGRDSSEVEAIWKDLFFATHATAVGAITSLALAAIDTALWDLRARRAQQPLWKVAGGAQRRVPVYTTEGGWLHHPAQVSFSITTTGVIFTQVSRFISLTLRIFTTNGSAQFSFRLFCAWVSWVSRLSRVCSK